MRPCCNAATETVEDDLSAARCQHKTVYHRHFCTRLSCVKVVMPHQKTANCDTRKFEMYTSPKLPELLRPYAPQPHEVLGPLTYCTRRPISIHSTCSTSPIWVSWTKPKTVAIRRESRAKVMKLPSFVLSIDASHLHA